MTRVIKYCFKTRAIFPPSIQLFHKVIIVLFLRSVICQHINVARLNDSSSESDLTGSFQESFFKYAWIPEREREREGKKRLQRCNDQKLSNYFHGARRGVSHRAQLHGGDSACREERRSERLSTARVSWHFFPTESRRRVASFCSHEFYFFGT